MTTINQHQCFMTRAEMLSAVVLHCRTIAVTLEQYLAGGVETLDVVRVEESAYRILQLAQGVKQAAAAEERLAESLRAEALN